MFKNFKLYFEKRGWDDEIRSFFKNFLHISLILMASFLTQFAQDVASGEIHTIEDWRIALIGLIAVFGRSIPSVILTSINPVLFPPTTSKNNL